MATYSSGMIDILSPAENVYQRLSDPENLRNLIAEAPADALSAEQKQQLDQIQLSHDSITIPGGPVGSIELRVTERREPELIRLEGVGTPVPLSLEMKIVPLSPESCQAEVTVNLQIPAMLKPMVNGPMQKMVNQFGTLLRHLSTI